MSTYLGLHYHIIFSTKNREPWLGANIRSQVHEYLGGTVRGLGGIPRGVGGVEDHVHLLVTLRATHTLSDFMRELKKSSSVWIKEIHGMPRFAWQDGYCTLTVSPSARSEVQAYIQRQEAHHRSQSYLDELRTLLNRAEIEYNEAHLA